MRCGDGSEGSEEGGARTFTFLHRTTQTRHSLGSREKLTSSVTAIASGRRLDCFQTRDGRVASEGNGASAKP